MQACEAGMNEVSYRSALRSRPRRLRVRHRAYCTVCEEYDTFVNSVSQFAHADSSVGLAQHVVTTAQLRY